jgi:hypothetical protein
VVRVHVRALFNEEFRMQILELAGDLTGFCTLHSSFCI